MWKILLQKHLIIALTILLLSGCAGGSPAEANEIDQQEAIDIAVEISSISMPEISGSQAAPSKIHAEKMTLEEATKRINANSLNDFSDNSPDLQVWLVTMDGIWLPAGGPDSPTPEPYRHLSLIIDAETGVEIIRNMQP